MRRFVLLVSAGVLAACSGATSVGDIAVGDCFDDPDEAIVSELQLIDCDQPHDNEVFANLQVEQNEYPATRLSTRLRLMSAFPHSRRMWGSRMPLRRLTTGT